jgi:hypothetical protein
MELHLFIPEAICLLVFVIGSSPAPAGGTGQWGGAPGRAQIAVSQIDSLDMP